MRGGGGEGGGIIGMKGQGIRVMTLSLTLAFILRPPLQDDVLPGTLTVYEYLRFTASLRLTPEQRAASPGCEEGVVWAVVEELGLTRVAHCFIGDAFVRGLSGERRGGQGGGGGVVSGGGAGAHPGGALLHRGRLREGAVG